MRKRDISVLISSLKRQNNLLDAAEVLAHLPEIRRS